MMHQKLLKIIVQYKGQQKEKILLSVLTNKGLLQLELIITLVR